MNLSQRLGWKPSTPSTFNRETLQAFDDGGGLALEEAFEDGYDDSDDEDENPFTLDPTLAIERLKNRGEWPRRSAAFSAWEAAGDYEVLAAFMTVDGKWNVPALEAYLGFQWDECDPWAPSEGVAREHAEAQKHKKPDADTFEDTTEPTFFGRPNYGATGVARWITFLVFAGTPGFRIFKQIDSENAAYFLDAHGCEHPLNTRNFEKAFDLARQILNSARLLAAKGRMNTN